MTGTSIERLKDYGEKISTREDPADMPGWVKLAIIHKILYSETNAHAAARFNRKGATLSNHLRSPAAKKWMHEVSELANNPVALAKAVIREHMLGVAIDRIAFLEMAKKAGDYVAGDRIAADLMDRGGIAKRVESKGGIPQVTLILNSPREMEPILIESEVVEEDD